MVWKLEIGYWDIELLKPTFDTHSSDTHQFARHQFWQAIKHLRHEIHRINKSVAGRLQNDHGDVMARQILLIAQIAVVRQ